MIACVVKLQLMFHVFTSGPTPQVASSAAHMYVQASNLLDVKDECMYVLNITPSI